MSNDHNNQISNTASLTEQFDNVGNTNDIYADFSEGKKFCYDDIPESFLDSDIWRQKLQTFISDIDNCLSALASQRDIDKLYDDFCQAMFNEIKENIRIKDCSKQTRKSFKYHKPFWNSELTNLWKIMRNAEKSFTRSNSNDRHKHRLKSQFLDARHAFDKCLRCTEREYYKNLANHIENINTNNPKEFWDHISKLGPKRCSEIPMRVYSEGGNINSDKLHVLKTWEKEFSSLYNPNENSDSHFDIRFLKKYYKKSLC
jgi:hypothetical protein